MSTRTLLPKPKKPATPRAVVIAEDYRPGFGKPLRVDRDAGIIHRIKILGWDSRNGRRYLPEAVSKKLALYEGAKAYSNHPAKATAMRATEDLLGIWHNPVVEPDGVYADLHYLKSHQLCERLCEDAERGLGLFAASHNADGRGVEGKDGILLITEILAVRSVDLVTNAGTVTNLRENYVPQTTLRQLIESSKATAPMKVAWLTLLEDEFGDMPMDAPVEPPAGADGNALLAQAIAAYITAGTEPDHEMATKLLKLMKPQSAETTTEGEDDDEEDDKEKKKVAESAKSAAPAPGTVTLTEAKAKRLIKFSRLKETPSLVKQVQRQPSDDAAMELLEYLCEATAPAVPSKGAPVRSQGQGGVPAPKTEDVPSDRSAFLKRLRPTSVSA